MNISGRTRLAVTSLSLCFVHRPFYLLEQRTQDMMGFTFANVFSLAGAWLCLPRAYAKAPAQNGQHMSTAEYVAAKQMFFMGPLSAWSDLPLPRSLL